GIAMLFPRDILQKLDAELFLFIGSIVLLAIVISVLAIIRFFKRRALEKDMKLIYNHFKSAKELTYLTVLKEIGQDTADVPVIRGFSEKGRFELCKEKEKFVFSIEYSGKPEEEKYAEVYVNDIDGAIKYIADFIAEN
ncbi:MAG: hypothetical protein IJW21_09175, partial [Clostridia bacterium]|nr:hypothetical protein [Clostridia bacterium]